MYVVPLVCTSNDHSMQLHETGAGWGLPEGARLLPGHTLKVRSVFCLMFQTQMSYRNLLTVVVFGKTSRLHEHVAGTGCFDDIA